MKKLKKEEIVPEQAKKHISEFKQFIFKGNILDMAIGVIIGGSFNKIVTSFVENILMPIISIFTGSADFNSKSLKIPIGISNNFIEIKWGIFIQNIINFLLIGIFIFLGIKFMQNLSKTLALSNEEEETPKEKPEDILLLEEIRDLLKKKNK